MAISFKKLSPTSYIERKAKQYTPKGKSRKSFREAIYRTSSKISKSTSKKTKKGKRQAGPGRPKKTYKHVNPLTGQPIPATQYYKLRKALKRKASRIEDQAEYQQRIALAKRGLSPEEIQQAEILKAQRMAMMRQSQMMQQPQVVQQVPIQQIRQIQMQPQQQFKIVTDLMTGRKILKRIPPKERWISS